MCSHFLVLIVLIVVADIGNAPVVASMEFVVGDREGWHIPDAGDTKFYDEWAARKRFNVGDSLRFVYQNDSVLVVDKYGYYHCVIEKAISSFTDGNTVITLLEPRHVYFISGVIEHCKDGQRLEVDVISPHDHASASPPYHPDLAMSPGPSSPSSGAVVSVTVILALVAVVLAFVFIFWCAP